MEEIAPHDQAGTELRKDEAKGNEVVTDRELGGGADIARIDRVYRWALSIISAKI
jgi:hypothetical protein